MKTLHEQPRFDDRWSYLYLEYGTLDQEASGLAFRNRASVTSLPIDQLNLIMLGPGTTVTHAAVKALAGNSCLVAWVGDGGNRLYAHSTGATFSSRRLLTQARLASDEASRLDVARRMYQKRFPSDDVSRLSMEALRGMEGRRVREAYTRIAADCGLTWEGRNYDQEAWFAATPANRALSAAHACLYGVCHAAIVAAGYSAALGFIHTGKMLSFVYDVADFYKTEVTVPLAFRLAASEREQLERKARIACREEFHRRRLLDRILPDIAEVLGVVDDRGESAEELEGRAVSLASGAEAGGVPGQPEPPSEGRTLDTGVQEEGG